MGQQSMNVIPKSKTWTTDEVGDRRLQKKVIRKLNRRQAQALIRASMVVGQ